jgi:hypothetical protein
MQCSAKHAAHKRGCEDKTTRTIRTYARTCNAHRQRTCIYYTHTGTALTCSAKQAAHTRACKVKATRTTRTYARTCSAHRHHTYNIYTTHTQAIHIHAVPSRQHTHAHAMLLEQHAQMQEHAVQTGTTHKHMCTTLHTHRRYTYMRCQADSTHTHM